ncbi:MAG: threonine/serine dehydratase [Acidobacteriota bacterium]
MIPLEAIRRAREVIARDALRTPLVKLNAPEAPAEIYLKLENLQPIGSFKIRGATNSLRRASPEEVARGVLTASAGNMAQGVAWAARSLGVPATIIVPETAPETKLAATERLGGKLIKVPFERWWKTIEESSFPGMEGLFIHPVEDDRVMAGNGTIGLEILEDLPEPDVVLIPWGGGGLSSGIASALRASKSKAKVYAVEVETAAPLRASLEAGSIQTVDHRVSFVDGIGSRSLLPKMWELGRELLDGALTASLGEIASAIRLLAERNRIIAEGAGACPVAVALSGRAGTGKIVCVVSGGNIDLSKLRKILAEETP